MAIVVGNVLLSVNSVQIESTKNKFINCNKTETLESHLQHFATDRRDAFFKNSFALVTDMILANLSRTYVSPLTLVSLLFINEQLTDRDTVSLMKFAILTFNMRDYHG